MARVASTPNSDWKNRRRIILVLICMVVVVVMGRDHVGAEAMRRHRATIEAFVSTHPVSAPFFFCAALSTVLACSLPGGVFLTATCGVLLSPWVVAVVTSWLAHIIGGVVNFSILRAAWYGTFPPLFRENAGHGSGAGLAPTASASSYDQRDGGGGAGRSLRIDVEAGLEAEVEEEEGRDEGAEGDPVSPRSREWITWMDKKVRGASPWLIVTLRLITPLFGPLNAAMAVVDVPLSTFLWTTAVGTLPPQILLTLFARQVADSLLEEAPQTPSPPEGYYEDADDAVYVTQSNHFWLRMLSPTTGVLPPRIKPWAVPIIVPLAWLTLLYVAGFAMQKWQLPETRMWRRHRLPHRSHGIMTL